MGKMKTLIFTLIITTIISCSKDEKKNLEFDLIGTWHGIKFESKNSAQPETNTTSDNISSVGGFAYANGLEIFQDGTLKGISKIFDQELSTTSWINVTEYISTWDLINETEVRLHDQNYEILNLNSTELILQYEHSTTVFELTLQKQ